MNAEIGITGEQDVLSNYAISIGKQGLKSRFIKTLNQWNFI